MYCVCLIMFNLTLGFEHVERLVAGSTERDKERAREMVSFKIELLRRLHLHRKLAILGHFRRTVLIHINDDCSGHSRKTRPRDDYSNLNRGDPSAIKCLTPFCIYGLGGGRR